MSDTSISNPLRADFIRAATWHGDLATADAMLASNPSLAEEDIHTAAILGDAEGVRKWLAADPGNAFGTCPPFGGNPLTHLCLSKYLRLERRPEAGFLEAARALLDAGADANGGFWTTGQYPEFETPLYGAAGVAHNPALTALLLEHGADPNDIEGVYHSPETYDNRAMKLLVETGRVTMENQVLMLVRKHDIHDYEGEKYLLEKGTDPNGKAVAGYHPMIHGISRCNARAMISLLMDHGGVPTVVDEGASAVAWAARFGRADLLKLFAERGFSTELDGVDALLAACALGDEARIQRLAASSAGQLRTKGATWLAQFALSGNAAGVKSLLALGLDPDSVNLQRNGYFEIPAFSTALHVASWLLWADVVRVLIEHRADVHRRDGNGNTPLMLWKKATVNSYWKQRASTEGERLLVDAGAGS